MEAEEMPTAMRTFTANVIQYGRITIPVETRKLLGISKGDNVTLLLIALARPSGEMKTINHLSASQRTFTKRLSRDSRVAIPPQLRALANIHEGDTATFLIAHVHHAPKVDKKVE